jgi:hypothetical protein
MRWMHLAVIVVFAAVTTNLRGAEPSDRHGVSPPH